MNNIHLNAEITKIADDRPTPWAMAARFAAQFPAAAQQAEQAAQFVDNGAVIQRQRHIAAADGQPAQTDLYNVDGKLCSHTGNHCECRERAAIDSKFGRLCSHRIAIMMYKKLMAANADALIAIIQAMQATDPARIVLMIDRYYRKSGEEDRKLVRYIGFGRDNGSRVDYQCIFEIDNAGLERAAKQTGWTFTSAPSKGKTFRFYYLLEPAAPGIVGDDARTLRQLDAAPFAAAEDRRRQLYAEGKALERQIAA